MWQILADAESGGPIWLTPRGALVLIVDILSDIIQAFPSEVNSQWSSVLARGLDGEVQSQYRSAVR